MKTIMMSFLVISMFMICTSSSRAETVFLPQGITVGMQNEQHSSVDVNYAQIEKKLFGKVQAYVRDIPPFEETNWKKVQHAVEIDKAMRQAI